MSLKTQAYFSRVFALLLVLLLSASCASRPMSPEQHFMDRAVTQQAEAFTVSAAVPNRQEARDTFGRDLYRQRIQPVWLKIHNRGDTPITLLPFGLDSHYYSPLEAAHTTLRSETAIEPGELLNQTFMDSSIGHVIMPGEQRSGYAFTRLDEGTKAFNVDIAWQNELETFTFFIQVPGLAIDHYTVDWENLYPPESVRELGDQELMEWLEGFTCCTRNKSGKKAGDPLNLVVIGQPIDLYTAFIRAGWDETEVVTRSSALKTLGSFFSGGEYRYSPISSLYVFGRGQDVALQKARDNIHERNHLRLWMSPVRYRGLPVWIGQISRDIGVRFTRKTITTHKIDPDVDETREFLLEDLAYAQSLYQVGYVRGVGTVSKDEPQGNLTGDPWFSDGYRLVLWVSPEPVAISDVTTLPWRKRRTAQ
jgi:hypothetical protein